MCSENENNIPLKRSLKGMKLLRKKRHHKTQLSGETEYLFLWQATLQVARVASCVRFEFVPEPASKAYPSGMVSLVHTRSPPALTSLANNSADLKRPDISLNASLQRYRDALSVSSDMYLATISRICKKTRPYTIRVVSWP